MMNTPTNNPKENFEVIKKVIKLLNHANNLLIENDYFNNETLITELKTTLHTSYLIEVELKDLVYKDKKTGRKKDEMFSLLAAKSKQSLSRIF